MNIKHFALAALAVLGIAACTKPEDLGPANVASDTSALSFTQEGGTQTITINSTIDWALKDYTDDVKEWIVIDPESGKASKADQKITIKVLENAGTARQATITFFGNVLAKATLTVSQDGKPVGTGAGTLEDPYDVAAANAYISTLGADVESAGNIYVKGTVVEMKEAFSSYGNCTCYLGNEGSDEKFYVFRALGLGNKKCTDANALKVGDEVVVCGKVVNYKGNTPETVQNAAYFYSINGSTGSTTPDVPTGTPKGTGTQADPYNVTAANSFTSSLASGAESDSDIYIKGKVKEIKDPFGTYGNCTMYICNEDADASASQVETFYVYRTYGPGNKKCSDAGIVKVGDIVVVCGKVTNYMGNTPETVQNKSYLYSINGSTESQEPSYSTGTAKGTGTEADPYNATGALAVAKTLAAGETSAADVYIKGFVKGTPNFSANYGDMTFNLVDEKGGNTEPLFVYQILSVGGAKFTSASALKDGDEIVVLAKLTNYNGTYETAKGGVTVSVNGSTDLGSGDTGGGETGGNTGNVSIVAGENETLYVLTNAEIVSALSATDVTGDSYSDLTINSESGNWTANINAKKGLAYVQLRNNRGSFLKSPVFTNNIKRVVISVNSQTVVRNIYAIPSTTTIVNGTKNDTYNLSANANMFDGAYGSAKTTGSVAENIAISFSKEAKDFSLVAYDGAVYLDAIYVFCEK